ncbi:MAG: Hsp20/alpha crystallin family protein [Paludibacteraceae bacterium]|nr:Hsp20/alpha crystallin family protein [Paludibacteraceae bacterium]
MLPVRHYVSNNWLPTLFNEFFDNEWMNRTSTTAPAINVSETEKDYKLEVAAPGMTKEDFSVSLDQEGNIAIALEKKINREEPSDKNRRYLRREFSYAKFHQTMTLPEDVDKERISARVNDGVLIIDLPKKEAQKEVPATRTIQID